jgi:hypothetical protein
VLVSQQLAEDAGPEHVIESTDPVDTRHRSLRIHTRHHLHHVGKGFCSGPVAQSKIGRSNFFAKFCLELARESLPDQAAKGVTGRNPSDPPVRFPQRGQLGQLHAFDDAQRNVGAGKVLRSIRQKFKRDVILEAQLQMFIPDTAQARAQPATCCLKSLRESGTVEIELRGGMVLQGFLGEWFLQVRRSSGRIAELAQRSIIAFRQPARTKNASSVAELPLLNQRRSRPNFSLHLLLLGSARPAAVLNGGLPAVR